MTNIEIRMAEKEDVSGIIDIYKPYILDTAITFDEQVPTEEEMWQRVKTIQDETPYLVCRVDGTVAGYAYISAYRSRASYRWAKEISVYIHPLFRKKKIAYALYSALFDIAKAQGIYTLLAVITIPNEPSIRFHEKLGFVKCAEFKNIGYKMDSWQTVGWWQFGLFENVKQPSGIVPLNEIISTEIYQEAIKKALSQIHS